MATARAADGRALLEVLRLGNACRLLPEEHEGVEGRLVRLDDDNTQIGVDAQLYGDSESSVTAPQVGVLRVATEELLVGVVG